MFTLNSEGSSGLCPGSLASMDFALRGSPAANGQVQREQSVSTLPGLPPINPATKGRPAPESPFARDGAASPSKFGLPRLPDQLAGQPDDARTTRSQKVAVTDLKQVWTKRNSSIDAPEHRAITLEQLSLFLVFKDEVFQEHTKNSAFGFGITGAKSTIQEVYERVVVPVVKEHRCSWVEVVTTKPQPADFFVCYSPENPLEDAVAALGAHSQRRGVGQRDGVRYWLRHFSERYEEVDTTTAEGLDNLPQLRVLASPSCNGSLLLLDDSENASPSACAFRSSWCLFELCESLKVSRRRPEFCFDLAAHVPSGALKFGDPQAPKGDPQAYEDVPACSILQYYNHEKREWEWERSGDDRAAMSSWLLREGVSFSWRAAANSDQGKQRPFPHGPERFPRNIKALKMHLKMRLASAAVHALCGGAPVMYQEDLDLVKSLATEQQVVNEPMSFGETAIFRAAAWGNKDAVTLLIARMAMVNTPRSDGTTPVQVARAFKRHRIIDLLTTTSVCPAPLEQEEARPEARQLLALQDDIFWSAAVNWNRCYDLGAFLVKMSAGPTVESDSARQNGILVDQLSRLGALVKTVFRDAVICNPDDGRQVVWRSEKNAKDTKSASMYELCDFIIKPLTKRFRCSWVRYITRVLREQQPRFFVSHWWGGAFQETLEKLRLHQESLDVKGEAYWFCTFANNQHDLSSDARLSEAAFADVLQSEACKGTLALVTQEATMFKRIWCVYELYLSEENKRKRHFRYDLATFNQQRGCAVLQLERLGERAGDQEATFPAEVALAGVSINLEKSESTLDKDKTAILKAITGSRKEKEAYDELNKKVQGRFAGQLLISLIRGSTMTAEERAEMQRLIREHPQSKDYQDGNGESVTFHAAKNQCEDALSILLEAGASTILPNKRGEIPVLIAFRNQMTAAKELQIQAVKELGKLRLRQSDQAVPSLVEMLNHAESLKQFGLVSCDISAETAALLGQCLAGMAGLEELSVEEIDLKGDGQVGRSLPLMMLQNKTHLKVLSVARCDMSTEVAEQLGLSIEALEPLEELDISDSPKAGLFLQKMLRNKTKLKRLKLARMSLPADVWEQLGPLVAALANLEELCLAGNEKVGPSLQAMLQNKTKLKRLALANCRMSVEVSVAVGPIIAGLRELEQLSLDGFELGGKEQAAQKLLELKKLILDEDCKVSMAGAMILSPVVAAMADLEELVIQGHAEVGSCLQSMLQNKPKLRKVHLAGCNVSGKVAAALGPILAGLEELQDLSLDGVKLTASRQAQKLKNLKHLDLAKFHLSWDVATALGPLIWAMKGLQGLAVQGASLKGSGEDGFLGLKLKNPGRVHLAGYPGSALVLLELIKAMEDLDELDLSQCPKVLQRLPIVLRNKTTLRKLSLAGGGSSTPVDAQLGTPIAAMPDLEELDISGWQVGSGLAAMLRNKEKLRVLNLAYCTFSAKAVHLLGQCMASLPELRKLDMAFCSLPPEAGQQLEAAAADLEELIIPENAIGPGLPAMLRNKTSLKKLDLARCCFSGEVAVVLGPIIAGMMNLEELTLDGVKLKGAPQAQKLQDLKSLSLAEFHLSWEVATLLGPVIWAMENLEELTIQGLMLKGPGKARALLKKSKHLNLAACKGSAMVLEPLIADMEDLEELTVEGNTQVAPGLPLLLRNTKRLSKLTRLNFAKCDLSAEVAKELGPVLSAMLNLQELDMSSNRQVGHGLSQLLANLKRLKRLSLVDCRLPEGVGKRMLDYVPAMANLEELDLRSNSLKDEVRASIERWSKPRVILDR